MIFGYLNCLPSLLIFWILVILPEVIENNMKITNKEKISQILSFFEAAYFLGLILGSLLWPNIITRLSKRNAIFVSLVF